MNAPWFFCPDLLAPTIELDERERRHAFTVLRLEPPTPITLFDGMGGVAQARLEPCATRARRRDAEPAIVVESVSRLERPSPALTLAVAACKGPRLDLLVEKCTELGANRLILVECGRSVVHLEARHAAKLRDTAIPACKQSHTPWLPQIETGITLGRLLERESPQSLAVAHLAPGAESIARLACKWIAHGADALVLVGPEGGFTDAELDHFRRIAAVWAQLAPQVLRVETAAVAVAAAWAAARVGAACGDQTFPS